MSFGQPINPCGDCLDGECTMNCSTAFKPGTAWHERMSTARTEADRERGAYASAALSLPG